MSSSLAGISPWRKRALSLSVTGDQTPNQPQNDQAISSEFTGILEVPNTSNTGYLSSSIPSSGFREPLRSFIQSSIRDHRAPIDSVRNARSVREDTAELASYLLSDEGDQRKPSFLQRSQPPIEDIFIRHTDTEPVLGERRKRRKSTHEIPEAHAASSNNHASSQEDGPSALANLLRKSPPDVEVPKVGEESECAVHVGDTDSEADENLQGESSLGSTQFPARDGSMSISERSPLLGRILSADSRRREVDLEDQKQATNRPWYRNILKHGRKFEQGTSRFLAVTLNPARWNHKAVWANAVVAPASCLPAVCVGLLLNILDALSYGMILFPLGKPIFAHLGSAGISMFYVSTIVSQLTFSSGSIFKGAVGSELIEVVPFFHNMAEKITQNIGADKPDAIIATTITSYTISSMLTGLVFWLMGRFNFGYMVGFIPRHILIGCIGGVGWFLVATGLEVSARLEGSLTYNLETLKTLIQPDTALLWVFPLVLAVALFWGQAKITSKYFLPLFILTIPLVFYIFVFSIDSLDVDALRDDGWIFEGPPSDEPWWYFYTLFKFHLVEWEAVAETIPAMFALTFFGILHVPINVPALALNCGEDNADLNKELRLHGYSNFLSGCFGSIQNYLVYANTVFFMRSGGNTRLAGYMLAVLTFCMMMIGPTIIGFIPIMMVGTLIFDLGFELLLEAIWLPRKKLKLAEFLTVIVIVLVMGIYDFVIGIGVGVILAFVALIVQTSRISAIRGSYAGDIVNSTVRRNPSQARYLGQVGRQIYIVKLTGYLFFGTIVSVEEKIRALLDDNVFAKQPIKFLVLDLWHVAGLDYSAGEAFNTISRLLKNKDVILVLSGIDANGQLDRNLRAVGLGGEGVEVTMLPDLNAALESCENELLKTLYARQEELTANKRTITANLDVPESQKPGFPSIEQPFNSPRRNHLAEAAHDAITSVEVQRPSKWQSFREPLRLMLQVFQGLSNKNEDFWFSATKYFKRKEYAAGTVLFRRGEQANGFYLIEQGIIRAEYDLPQGWLCESIVAGTTCGELPFFSETDRTATAVLERDGIVWFMDKEDWGRLQEKEPDVARELLRISLKLTRERMDVITSYILATAG